VSYTITITGHQEGDEKLLDAAVANQAREFVGQLPGVTYASFQSAVNGQQDLLLEAPNGEHAQPEAPVEEEQLESPEGGEESEPEELPE